MRIALIGLALLAGLPARAPALAQAAPAGAGEARVLPLQGGRNFRDLGGYRTADGRTVKWGLLYRSGAMSGLTPADYAELSRRGIQVVCDFRDQRERTAEPSRWPEGTAPRILSDDYSMDTRFLPTGDPRGWTAEQVRGGLAAAYPAMLKQFNGQYRRMFAELLAGHAPLAFHCTAGKDRTGIAAALLLTALGVPRETVIEDYLLTNRYLDPASMMGSRGAMPSALAALPPEVLKPLMLADKSYIEAALAEVDRHPGGVNGYLKDELGLGPSELKRLRRLYTKPATA